MGRLKAAFFSSLRSRCKNNKVKWQTSPRSSKAIRFYVKLLLFLHEAESVWENGPRNWSVSKHVLKVLNTQMYTYKWNK